MNHSVDDALTGNFRRERPKRVPAPKIPHSCELADQMSAQAARLRQQAEKCLRLAEATTDEKVAEALRALAAESLAQAYEIERGRNE